MRPRRHARTAVVAIAVVALAACSSTAVPAAPPTPSPSASAAPAAPVVFLRWTDPVEMPAKAAGTTIYDDPIKKQKTTWEYATWTSTAKPVGFGATELVASWNATTPAGTWLQVEMLGTYSNGRKTPAYVLGRWASGDADIARTSVDDQSDDYSKIDTDTFRTTGDVTLTDVSLRVTLYRKPGRKAGPSVRALGAFASALPDRDTGPAGATGIAWGTELKVPAYSQDVHSGQYPQYDGGGEAWCSPTSTSMVVAYWGRKPDTSWVDRSYADPQVDAAARGVYDYTYEGAGNWPFNAAYAASFGLDAVVTQIRSLDEAETYIEAGIPVIASVAFAGHELDGANYSTDGHLLVIVGFTKDGDVIVNDPASRDDAAVRNVYKRQQFADVWLRTTHSSSGGVAYLIKPPDRAWPAGLLG